MTLLLLHRMLILTVVLVELFSPVAVALPDVFVAVLVSVCSRPDALYFCATAAATIAAALIGCP